MAYDEKLAARVRILLGGKPAFSERRMFGGMCYLLDGNMCAGVLNDELIVRIAPAEYEDALSRPHVRAFDFAGRPMKGFVVVEPKGCSTAKRLAGWLDLGIGVARTAKAKKSAKKPTGRRPTGS